MLALMNKTWNEAATIVLYGDIDLIRPRAIWHCIKTLSLPPQTMSFGRDLAIYAQSIYIRHPLTIRISSESKKALGDMLLQLLPRMINVHSFSCDIVIPEIPRFLLWTTDSRSASIRTLSLPPDWNDVGQPRWTTEDEFGSDVPLDRWPILSSLALQVYSANTIPYLVFLTNTIRRTPNDLRVLSLHISAKHLDAGASFADLLSRLPIFQRLETFTTSLPARFLALPCFARAPRLTSLTVYTISEWPVLHEADYFTLEVLSCRTLAIASWAGKTCALDALLPNVQGGRRPIHTLRLQNASYRRYDGGFCPDGLLRAAVPAALAFLARSGVPIHHIGTFVPEDAINSLTAPDIKPQLQHLESLDLLIVYSELPDVRSRDSPQGPRRVPLKTDIPTRQLDPLSLGARLIAHMPRLHTFLLSEGHYILLRGPRYTFPWAKDEVLQRQVLADFDGRTSVLRRVALTAEFEWEKRADGQWHAWGHVVPDRPLPPLGRQKEIVALDEC
ncbi:hypothetical protein TRAPUB_7533 [Trametes pubescens]|uniref:Uncharacterized protein n=1 Tax=Trametes pubescens TaxID=154538 RepID=A0A1M2V311_TRAPU|nr:hypothetical protein TRAPUB_7533 [Trametes pubescens]